MTRRSGACLLTLAAVGALMLPGIAAADTVDGGGGGWGPLTVGGATQAFTGTMTLGGGFPAATFASDSRAPVQIPSGAGTYLNANTPVGAKYGSSQGKGYINLHPKADNATSPSTTTYTFDSATPTAGWTFVLGDIDADSVVVSATDATGAAVPAAGLGFKGAFNYCGGSPAPCPADADVPTWNGAGELIGNAGASDTSGAAAWFEPTSALKTLTFTYYQRSGLPVYQTWFASLANDVSGTVTGCPGAAGAPSGGAPVKLIGPGGSEVAATVTAPDGTYSFTNYTAAPGYKVEATAAADCVLDATSKPADLGAGDVTGLNFVATPKAVDPDPEPCDQAAAGSAGSSVSAGSSGSSDRCGNGSGSGSGPILNLLESGSSGGTAGGSTITSGMQ
ncbi:hypothetical protein [Rhodococcus sp. UNC363MFTsu5.1]|uniref:hypothetical protein n=1 Tax=Rhodococcus sp. UNC363MFTsu5.1 TaxID=1449069 RepID=UPI000A5CA922|nr:hypothetical protein [Rhodococcus sp. UNC363MFTsu5.1]